MLELKIKTFKKGDLVSVMEGSDKGKKGVVHCITLSVFTGATETKRYLVKLDCEPRVVTLKETEIRLISENVPF